MEEMLSWMDEIAKNPGGLSDAARKELKSTVLLVREARLRKKYTSDQKKQMIGPSLYKDDPPAHVEATRSSLRISTMTKKLKYCSCCSASSTKRKRVENHSEATESRPAKINIGPEFQAEIPPWTGQVSEDNSMWAGTRVWLPANLRDTMDDELVLGKGRSDCECPNPGSLECIRSHNAENTMKLKNELGEALNQWRFDVMDAIEAQKKKRKVSRKYLGGK